MIHLMRIIIVAGCLLIVMGVFSFFLWDVFFPEKKEAVPVTLVEEAAPAPREVVSVKAPQQEAPLPESFLIPNVPFTVQAPLGQWQDPLYQDGCEEASLAMARAWVQGTVLTAKGVTEEIAKLALFEKKQFGQSVDTSIQDTAWLLENYHGITTGVVGRGVMIDMIKRALVSGKIVIVPADGRKLKNPNFKQPGPPRHMLVIVGYDDATAEFIVNDPGTRHGEGYRYAQDVLYGAILDYSTGKHVEVTSVDKVMLTVGREQF